MQRRRFLAWLAATPLVAALPSVATRPKSKARIFYATKSWTNCTEDGSRTRFNLEQVY
jgi:hypothetical protein